MESAFVKTQYDLAYGEGIEAHWWHRARNWILLGELRKCLRGHSKVLDIGCGRGIAVRYLREQGICCDGVELATTSALSGVEEHIRYGTNAQDLPIDVRMGYEVLMLLDVVEHLPQPEAFVRELIAAFPRTSHVVITVPARQELWTNYDEYFGHHRRYTLQMLSDLARASDLELVRKGYFFHALYVPARTIAALGRTRMTRVEPPRGSAKGLHAVLTCAMLLDYFILPTSLPGASAIATFRVRQSRTSS